MRILITTDTVGGVWTYTKDLVEGLLSAGHQVCLASLGDKPDIHQSAAMASLTNIYPGSFCFFAMNYPLEWMPGDTRTPESMKALVQLVENYKPDLLHFNQYCYGSMDTKLPKLVVAHSDVVSWWHECMGESPPEEHWHQQYRSIVASGLASADCVVSPTRWQLDQLHKHYGCGKSDGAVIPNGARHSDVAASRRLQAVSAGRMWDRAKNLEVLENADLEIPLYVAGDAEVRAQPATAPALKNNAHKLGRLSHPALQELLATSALYIAPSLYEPFGLAPLEAAHAGCALLLNDIPTFREVWQEDALYFSAQYPKHLHAQVRTLVADTELLGEMGTRAQDRARKLYGLDTFIASYLGLYQSLLSPTGLYDAA